MKRCSTAAAITDIGDPVSARNQALAGDDRADDPNSSRNRNAAFLLRSGCNGVRSMFGRK